MFAMPTGKLVVMVDDQFLFLSTDVTTITSREVPFAVLIA